MHRIVGIHYINLDKNIGKRILMVLLLIGFKYPRKRISGVYLKKIERTEPKYLELSFEKKVCDEVGFSRQLGIAGCWLAHYNAIRNISSQEGVTVILEDDFVCKKDFFREAVSMLGTLGNDFDIVFFDPWGDGPIKKDQIEGEVGKYAPSGIAYPNYQGSHCLFVNNRSAIKILDIIENAKICDYDGFLLCNKEIKTYAFYTGKSKNVYLGSDLSDHGSVISFLKGAYSWLKFKYISS